MPYPASLPLRSFHVLFVALFLLMALSLFAGVTPPGYPPFSETEYHPAGLGPKEPDLEVEFPGSAINRGITKGSAMVSVLVDADGNVIDRLVIGCTDLAFGQKLLDQVPVIKFQAAKFKGVAVPARLKLSYMFESKRAEINPMDAARHRIEQTTGLKLVYSAVAEKELDQPLEFTNAVLPQLPEGVSATEQNPVKVFVTFYVDEDGHVRAPNVESAVAPQLIPGAIAAVQQWSFKRPTAKGKPALVFVGRAVRFVPRQSARAEGGSLALVE